MYKRIQLVWCWPMKLSIICNSGIVLKLDQPKQNLLKDDLFSCSVPNSHRLSWTAKK
jgi:hypothetical protein